jgi:hypothetical protein
MSYEQAMERATRDEGFKATVYAMNSLLLLKGVYTHEEFQQLFVEWIEKEERKKARATPQQTPTHAHTAF